MGQIAQAVAFHSGLGTKVFASIRLVKPLHMLPLRQCNKQKLGNEYVKS